MESKENMNQARIQDIRARQHSEDLLSISSHHCECMRSRQRAESTARTISEVRDQHRRQANYERRLRSNVLTADERQDIRPSPAISSHLHPVQYYWSHAPAAPSSPPTNGHEFLGADPSGGCCARYERVPRNAK